MGNKARILIVDDDTDVREALQTFCRLVLGLDVVALGNGSEAVALLDKEKFDIILQDLQMPGMDGFTVLAHAAARYPEIFKVVLTGILDPGVTKRIEDMDAVFIAKPFEPRALKMVIDRAFDEHPVLKRFAYGWRSGASDNVA